MHDSLNSEIAVVNDMSLFNLYHVAFFFVRLRSWWYRKPLLQRPTAMIFQTVIELQTLEEIVINDTLSHKALPLNFSDAPVCAA